LLAVAGADLKIVVDPERVRAVELPEMRGDASRLRAATGWEPEVPLDDTLASVLEYWQRQVA
jgi:GDP-4-dehydro-6-deoxy-D-mannose reductase